MQKLAVGFARGCPRGVSGKQGRGDSAGGQNAFAQLVPQFPERIRRRRSKPGNAHVAGKMKLLDWTCLLKDSTILVRFSGEMDDSSPNSLRAFGAIIWDS